MTNDGIAAAELDGMARRLRDMYVEMRERARHIDHLEVCVEVSLACSLLAAAAHTLEAYDNLFEMTKAKEEADGSESR